jgi:hypothetical protein
MDISLKLKRWGLRFSTAGGRMAGLSLGSILLT